jgi:hypothetical protein
MCVHFKLFEALFFWGGVTGHLLPFLKEKSFLVIGLLLRLWIISFPFSYDLGSSKK